MPTPRRPSHAGVHTPPATARHREAGAKTLWDWARAVLVDALGDLPDAAQMTATFLSHCRVHSATLARLADAGERDAFELTVLTLADERLHVTARRTGRGKWTGPAVHGAAAFDAFDRWLARARTEATPQPHERAAMGPAWHAEAERMLSRALGSPPPAPADWRRPDLRLMEELDFALSYVPRWTKGQRERTVRDLLFEWMPQPKVRWRPGPEEKVPPATEVMKRRTANDVRLTTERWQRALARERDPSSTIYVATVAAAQLAGAGRLRYAAPGARGGPGIAERVHPSSTRHRASLVAALKAAGLTVLPTPPRRAR